MANKFVIGLTDREREMHATNATRMAEALAVVGERLKDPERDVETMVALVIVGLQATNIDQMMKAIMSATQEMEIPETPEGADGD